MSMAGRTIAIRHPLVSQLADRIRNPASLDEPYLIQDRVPQTHSRHVVVIWDAWANVEDGAERGGIIADAFQDAGVQDVIRVGTGLTQQEARSMGYLPYQIVANLKKTDGQKIFRAIKSAIEDAPGIHVRTGSSIQLRYPTLDHAQEAYRRLSATVPGPYWTIVKEEGAGE
jgi:hypothetical protein